MTGLILHDLDYYERRNIMQFVLLFLVLIIGFAFKLTGGYIFRYAEKIKEKSFVPLFMGVQIIVSCILGLALPNNYLVEIKYIHDLYEKNELLIPVSMLLLVILSMLTFAVVYDLLLGRKNSDQSN